MPFVKQAQEGTQGDTRFFTTALRWGELAQLAVLPDDLARELESEGVDEAPLQRALARSRLTPLVTYLTEVPDHFFSALTLIILPRVLDRPARESSGSDDEWDYYFERAERAGPGRATAGTIHLSGDVHLFPADGQHRLQAALEAIRVQPSLAREEVPVVLIPYAGRDQVSQLFADLNLNAKPVNKTVGYALDTRSPAVAVAKRAAAALPLFARRVHRASNSLPRTSAHVITMNGLVEGTRNLVAGRVGTHDPRRQDAWIEAQGIPAATDVVAADWAAIHAAFARLWEPVLAGDAGAAGNLRDEYVFPHGLGWLALTTAAGTLRERDGDAWAEGFRRAVQVIDWRRTNPEWEGRATAGGAVSNTAPGIRATAEYIVEHATRPDR